MVSSYRPIDKDVIVTISKRTLWVFMSDCIYDTQLALLGLSLSSGVLLRLRHVWPGTMSYQ